MLKMIGEERLAFAFGILGNIISFMVFLAPIPTFYRVYKKKATEGFQCFPYVVALFSSMLWVFFALVKTNESLLITINSFGCFIETVYIIIYLIYAPMKAKISTIQTVVFLNVILFGVIAACTLLLSHGEQRTVIIGWICVAFSISVFAAPLSIMRLVIRTKSVEFMPFNLSLFLTLSATAWLCYGVLSKDKYVAMPNILGLLFGTLQMLLYCRYKDSKAGKAALVEKATAAPAGAAAGYSFGRDMKAAREGEGGNDCAGVV